MTRIGIVSVHYYDDYLGPSLRAVARLAERIGAGTTVAVANRPGLAARLEAQAGAAGVASARCIEHDNTGLEFGAYQAGLDRLLESDPDWVVFANDTFAVHSCFYRVYLRHLRAALALPPGADLRAAGEVVSTPRSFTIGGARTNRWLTTSVFALNRAALRAVDDRVYHPQIDALVRPAPTPEAFFSDELDEVLVAHLANWLFGVPGQGAWYGAAPLTAESAPRLALKARSILQEKYLAARLDQAGAWFFDLNPYGVREKIFRRIERAIFEARARLGPAPRNVAATSRQ